MLFKKLRFFNKWKNAYLHVSTKNVIEMKTLKMVNS